MPEARSALVVDIDPDSLHSCRAMLEQRGYTVFEASSAQAALMLAHGPQKMALALIEVNLGNGVNGWELRDCFRRLGIARSILLMSDDARHGADCLIKPINPEDLAGFLS